MFGFGMQELLVVLAIVLLIFGPKRLKNIGADLGNAIKGFRTAVSDEDKAQESSEPAAAKVIDGENVASDSATETQQPASQETKS
jgi:sec-independent protein translocase protein TatA